MQVSTLRECGAITDAVPIWDHTQERFIVNAAGVGIGIGSVWKGVAILVEGEPDTRAIPDG